MVKLTRRTIRNGGIGAVVGLVLGVVPIVLLVAPFVGGAVAGYLERAGAKRGALAGGIAGALIAVIGAVVVAVVVAVRFGDLPFVIPDAPLETLVLTTALSLAASIGQILVAAVGGGLGGLLEADRRRTDAPTSAAGVNRLPTPVRILVSLFGGLVTFGIVAFAVTAALDPFIWPSALVGLPAGLVTGAAVAVVGYHYLTHRHDQKHRLRWRTIGVGALVIAVVFALAIGGLFVLGEQRTTETAHHTYHYDVTVATDDTLESVTLYVPLPVGDETGASALGDRFVEDVQYQRLTPSVDGYEPRPDPVEFDYEMVETEYGPMLAIETDRIDVTRIYYRTVENETLGWHERIEPEEYDPNDPSMGVQDDGTFRFSIEMAANDSLDTADPFDSEPLLAPKSELEETDCYHAGERARCYSYESVVYASYEIDTETSVYVAAELSGRNEWFRGGWSGNEYREWTSVELVGPQDGWVVTNGELEVGVGSYR